MQTDLCILLPSVATQAGLTTRSQVFSLDEARNANTVKPVLRDHVKQDTFWLFRQVVAYCCMKVVQKASVELSALLSFVNKQPPVYSDFHVT